MRITSLLCVISLLIILASPIELHAQNNVQPFSKNNPALENNNDQAQWLINNAVRLLNANRNEEALSQLQQAVLISPQNAEAHKNLGIAYNKLGESSKAVEQFRSAVQIDPHLDSAWLNLGATNQVCANTEGALSAYREFIARFPQNDNIKRVNKLIQVLTNHSNLANLHTTNSTDPLTKSANDYFEQLVHKPIITWTHTDMPLRIFITSGKFVEGYKSNFDLILAKSFQDWAQASANLVSFVFVNNPNDAQIICYWTAEKNRFSNSIELGETKLYADPHKNNFLPVKGTITVSTKNWVQDLPITDETIRRITLHQIGHALGITGHSLEPNDVMFPSNSHISKWQNLSERDRNTLIRLYSY